MNCTKCGKPGRQLTIDGVFHVRCDDCMPSTFKHGSRLIPIDSLIKPTDHHRILACGEHMAVEWQNRPQETDPNLEGALKYLFGLGAATGVWIEAMESELALLVEFAAWGVCVVHIYEFYTEPEHGKQELSWHPADQETIFNSRRIPSLMQGFAEAIRVIRLFEEGFRRGGGRPVGGYTPPLQPGAPA